jgi:integrase
VRTKRRTKKAGAAKLKAKKVKTVNETMTCNVGWHRDQDKAPHQGKGSATVEPITSKADIKRIKENLRAKPRDYALFVCGINLGLRGTDLLNLSFEHFLRPDRTFKTHLKLRESKNNNLRRIKLCDNVKEAIQRLLSAENEPCDLTQLVFQSRKVREDGNRRMSITTLHQLVCKWCGDAGIEGNFGSHTLRKTYGYLHYKKNSDRLIPLMKMFGHSAPSITLKYIGSLQEEIDSANMNSNF